MGNTFLSSLRFASAELRKEAERVGEWEGVEGEEFWGEFDLHMVLSDQ